MFLQWCGDVLPKVYIFVQHFVSGTGRGFGSAPLKKHKRWAQGSDEFQIEITADTKNQDREKRHVCGNQYQLNG
jgi:hypothetical protein